MDEEDLREAYRQAFAHLNAQRAVLHYLLVNLWIHGTDEQVAHDRAAILSWLRSMKAPQGYDERFSLDDALTMMRDSQDLAAQFLTKVADEAAALRPKLPGR